jgi:Putative transposase
MGAVDPEAAALFHAVRRGGTEHGAAYLPAGHRAKPICQQPRCGQCGQDGTTALVQATWRKRILRAFVGRNLLESFQAKEMLGYQHSGFSLDAGVCIAAHERAAL